MYTNTMNYPKKNRFKSVAALCPYNIQCENLVFKNSLCLCLDLIQLIVNCYKDSYITKQIKATLLKKNLIKAVFDT